MAREDVVGDLAPFVGYGGHDRLCPLDRSLRDGRPYIQERVLDVLKHAEVTIVIPPKSHCTEQHEYDQNL